MTNDNDNQVGELDRAPATTGKAKMIRVTGLWVNRDAAGKVTSLQGNIGGARVVIIPNKKRESQTAPEWIMCFAAQEPRRQEGGEL